MSGDKKTKRPWLRLSIRYKMLLVILAMLLLTLGSYLYLATTLFKQDKDLCSSDLRHQVRKAALAQELLGLGQHPGRAGTISLCKSQAGEKCLTGSGCVNSLHLPRKSEALLRVVLGCIQVVPLVKDAGQAQIRLSGSR